MLGYLIKRIFLMIPTMIGISIVAFPIRKRPPRIKIRSRPLTGCSRDSTGRLIVNSGFVSLTIHEIVSRRPRSTSSRRSATWTA